MSKDLAALIAAAEATGRAALAHVGVVMTEVMRHSRALDPLLEMLQEYPLDRLAKATGQSQEELIAELQGSAMDYREFYYFKMESSCRDA